MNGRVTHDGERVKRPRPARLRIFGDAKGEFRWRLVGGNGEIMAVSAEGYTRRLDCSRALRTVKAAMLEAI